LIKSKLEKLKIIFTSEYWLITSLCGAFFTFFALNRGGVVVFIEASFILLLINFVSGKYLLKTIPASYWVALAICAYLLGTSILFHPKVSHHRWMANLLRMLCVVYSIHCLSQKNIKNWVSILFFVVLSVAVCWQTVALHIFKMPFGTFSNPHYLSSFAVLVLPFTVYASMVTKHKYRFGFIPIVLLNMDLIFKIESRPAFLGLIVATFFVIIFLNKGRKKWGGLLLTISILVVLFATNYGNIQTRFEELIVTLPNEERIKVWTAVWNMLKDNSFITWIFGNGIGAYRGIYPQYIAPEVSALNFPHLHLLELCYESGIIGMILVFGGILSLLVSLVKVVKKTEERKTRILIKCILVAFISWMIHAGLTFPFYSKYSQYSLAFILGTLLAVLNDPACNRGRALIAQNANAKLR
jgi:hypothetical protein